MKSYCGGCLFVDLATNYTHNKLQMFLNTAENIHAVDGFKKHARDFEIIVESHSSNKEPEFTSA